MVSLVSNTNRRGGSGLCGSLLVIDVSKRAIGPNLLAAVLVAIIASGLVGEHRVMHAETDHVVTMYCVFLAGVIDGDNADAPLGSDFLTACDGLSSAEIGLISSAVGDEDGTLEPGDLDSLDLEGNQITAATASSGNLKSIYVIAFVDDDGGVIFDADSGVIVNINDDGGNDETSPPVDGNPETCDGQQDDDCGDTIQDNGDGVVVATVTANTANQGDQVDVDVTQEGVGQIVTLLVMGAPDEVALSFVEGTIQTRATTACIDGEVEVRDDAAISNADSTIAMAVVTDSDARELTRIPTIFSSDDPGIAEVGDNSVVTVEFGQFGIAALAVICGGEFVGATFIVADIGTELTAALIQVDSFGDGDGDGMPDFYENAHNCLSAITSDADVDADADGSTNGEEYLRRSEPCDPDTDDDFTADGADNCVLVHNFFQTNSDSIPHDNGPGIASIDTTVANGDGLGDACDDDDDNDGLLDVDDGTGVCGESNPGLHPSAAGGDVTNDDDGDGNPAPPLGSDMADDGPSWDVDNDGTLDGYECSHGSDPSDPTSLPSPEPPSPPEASEDLDSDGLPNEWERRGWGTDPNHSDSDGDGIGDCVEVMDLDGNGVVNFAGDTIPVAKASVQPGFGRTMAYDFDKNGVVNFAGDAISHARRAVGAVACL
jgi:hypothetical protein